LLCLRSTELIAKDLVILFQSVRQLHYKNNDSKRSGTQSKGRVQNRYTDDATNSAVGPVIGAATDDLSPTFSLADLKAILKQLTSCSRNSASISLDPSTSFHSLLL